MDDLISRQVAVDALAANMPSLTTADGSGQFDHDIFVTQEAYVDCMQIIHELPFAQQEQKVGEWQITDAYPHNVYCSVCHKKFAQTHWAVWQDGSLPREYCPNCGSKMERG